jgi:hypothetical protein
MSTTISPNQAQNLEGGGSGDSGDILSILNNSLFDRLLYGLSINGQMQHAKSGHAHHVHR